jgi:glycosyltransferase involved in cell wall biosynthesis
MGERHRILATFLHEYQYGRALGGVERRFVEVSKHFSESGILITAIEYPPSIGPALSARYTSVLVAYHKPKTVLAEAFQLVRLSVLTIVWGRRSRCELVYSPSSIHSQVIPAFIASFVLKKPLVVVFHSPPSASVMTGFFSTLTSHRSRGESLMKSVVMTFIQTLGILAYRRTSMCIAVSRATAEKVLTSFPASNLVVSGNGVGDEWFDGEEEPKLYDACFLGRVSPRKSVDLLLLAWQKVVRGRPGAKLIIIGGGEDPKYVGKCHEMVTSLGLENNVVMSGFLEDDRVRRALDSSRIFVLPSRREGFGLAVVEAMARGVPCILTSLSSLRENFGDSAVFVTEPDPEAWANSILGLLGDENARNRMSESGRRHARRFRWEEVARREAFAIRSLIEARNR